MPFGQRKSIPLSSGGMWSATSSMCLRIRSPAEFLIIRVGLLSSITAALQTGLAASPACAALGGTGTASITTDIPGTLAPYGQRMSIFGLYFQDDYRIRPNLDQSIWGFATNRPPCPMKSRAGLVRSLLLSADCRRPAATSLRSTVHRCSGNVTCQRQFPGHSSRNNTKKDFSPRVGFRVGSAAGNGENVHSRRRGDLRPASSPCLHGEHHEPGPLRFLFQAATTILLKVPFGGGRYILRLLPDATHIPQPLPGWNIGLPVKSAHQAAA